MSTKSNNSQSNGGSQSFDWFLKSQNWNTEAASAQIDSKDLGIIQDELYHEALAYKKCSLYSQYFTEPQLQSMAGQAAKHHKQHFDALQGYLNSHQ